MAIDTLVDGAVVASNEAPLQVFQTVADLKKFPTANTPGWVKSTTALAVSLGFATAGDGYGAMYYWDPASTDADNGPVVVQPTAITSDATVNPTGAGRWLLLLCCSMAPSPT